MQKKINVTINNSSEICKNYTAVEVVTLNRIHNILQYWCRESKKSQKCITEYFNHNTRSSNRTQWKVTSLIFFLGPLCFMLFTAKTFVIVSLHFEELFEVNFAVNDALQCCIGAHTEE